MNDTIGELVVLGVLVFMSALLGVWALRWKLAWASDFYRQKLRALAWTLIIVIPFFYLWWLVSVLLSE